VLRKHWKEPVSLATYTDRGADTRGAGIDRDAVSPSAALTTVPGSPFAVSGADPRAIVIDPRGKFVYVANAQSNTISILEIDAKTGTLQDVSVIGAGTLPLGLAITPDGR
jgi:YVTN family beta-propeller protein